MLTKSKVREIVLENFNENVSEFVEELIWNAEDKTYTTTDGVLFTLVESYDGYVDGPRVTQIVFTVNDQPELYAFNGYYDSYDGTDWEDDIYIEEKKEVISYEYVTIG